MLMCVTPAVFKVSSAEEEDTRTPDQTSRRCAVESLLGRARW